MQPLSIRLCTITPEADELVEFLGLGLGFPCVAKPLSEDPEAPTGGVFHTADGSRIEVWKDGPQMPAGVMLQIEVEDADKLAVVARSNGLDPRGPMLTRGEKIYYLMAPGGLAMTFQSKLEAGESSS
ncbi:MAG: hypothetical protein ACI9F9_003061 [Candidatus Paceibacteria bacterium]|jgi:hypothetical protein